MSDLVTYLKENQIIKKRSFFNNLVKENQIIKNTSFKISFYLNQNMTRKKSSITYPIFTVRWLSVHALAVPTVFFLGSITSMQFIQR